MEIVSVSISNLGNASKRVVEGNPYVSESAKGEAETESVRDGQFLGGLEMNRCNKSDPFMIILATTVGGPGRPVNIAVRKNRMWGSLFVKSTKM